MVRDLNPHYNPDDVYGIGAVVDPALDDMGRDDQTCRHCDAPIPGEEIYCEEGQHDRRGAASPDTRSQRREWQPDHVAVVVVDESLETLAQALARVALRRRGREGTMPSRSKASVRLLDDLGTFERDHLGDSWRDQPALAKVGSVEADTLLAAVREQDTTQPVVYDTDGDPLADWRDVDADAWVVAGVIRHRVRTFEDCPTRVLACRDCGPSPHAHRGRERVDARVDDPLVTGTDLWTCKHCYRTRTGPRPDTETTTQPREWPDTTNQEYAHEATDIGAEMAGYIQEHRYD